MFEKLKDTSITMKNRDTLATRCTMVNYKGDKKNTTISYLFTIITCLHFCNVFQLDSAVYVGSTNEDEMCNFYMMYWVEGRHFIPTKGEELKKNIKSYFCLFRELF